LVEPIEPHGLSPVATTLTGREWPWPAGNDPDRPGM